MGDYKEDIEWEDSTDSESNFRTFKAVGEYASMFVEENPSGSCSWYVGFGDDLFYMDEPSSLAARGQAMSIEEAKKNAENAYMKLLSTIENPPGS